MRIYLTTLAAGSPLLDEISRVIIHYTCILIDFSLLLKTVPSKKEHTYVKHYFKTISAFEKIKIDPQEQKLRSILRRMLQLRKLNK